MVSAPKAAPCKVGDRIRLERMENDPDPIPVGTCGTVRGLIPFLDTWQIQVDWDVPRSLQLVWPADEFTVLPSAADPTITP